MATLCPILSFSLHHTHKQPPALSSLAPPPRHRIITRHNSRANNHLNNSSSSRCLVVFASSQSSSPRSSSQDDDGDINNNFSSSKKSVLLNLIQEIEPLDVSIIQKDVPVTTLDAMKRTISGMLGLLPSDRFQVLIEALWEPLSKLLVSSMMTGYTLRNADYRLSLEKNFGMHEGTTGILNTADSRLEAPSVLLDHERRIKLSREDETSKSESSSDGISEIKCVEGLGNITPEAQQYISILKSRLHYVKKELREVKRKSAALQMQQFVGEEKNDLLDYLRSLRPEKVAELSEPTCPELKEAIYSVVHGLLATLSPKMHSKPPISENTSSGIVNVETEEDCVDVVENASLQYQPLISLNRDYLARLLFWCMLLGHYLRGLEYRMELTDLLSLPINVENYPCEEDRAG